jgi:hypothetical protein
MSWRRRQRWRSTTAQGLLALRPTGKTPFLNIFSEWHGRRWWVSHRSEGRAPAWSETCQAQSEMPKRVKGRRGSWCVVSQGESTRPHRAMDMMDLPAPRVPAEMLRTYYLGANLAQSLAVICPGQFVILRMKEEHWEGGVVRRLNTDPALQWILPEAMRRRSPFRKKDSLEGPDASSRKRQHPSCVPAQGRVTTCQGRWGLGPRGTPRTQSGGFQGGKRWGTGRRRLGRGQADASSTGVRESADCE